MQQRAHDGQALNCKHWTNLLSAVKGLDCTPRAKCDIYDWLIIIVITLVILSTAYRILKVLVFGYCFKTAL